VKTCVYCGEVVTPEESEGAPELIEGRMHKECGIRMLLGSAAHIRMECSCYREEGAVHEPEDEPRRESARRAAAALRLRICSARSAAMN